MPAPALQGLLDGLDASGLEVHSLMVVVRGAVVAEGWWAPYAPQIPHALFSLSKSFTSAAVGFAEAAGLLSVDDLVLTHLPDDAPPGASAADGPLSRLRLRHLLTMTTGHHDDPSDAVFATDHWARAFLATPVEHEPGTHFVYNTAATYLLSVIVQKVTGQRVLDYLTPRLLEPLGIEGATWEQSPQGVDTGGFGMSLTTEDIACFGALLLADGVWDGRQVLPAGWVAEATRAHGPSVNDNPDWQQGYGYQFWRGRHGSFRGDGAFGQFCVVLPEEETVVAITAGTMDMQGVLDQVWEHLLPAVRGGVPAAGGEDAEAALRLRLDALAIAPPAGEADGAVGEAWAGRQIALEPNRHGIEWVRFMPAEGRTLVEVHGPDGTTTVEAGRGAWLEGHVPLPAGRAHAGEPGRVEPVVAALAWPEPTTAVLTVRLVQTPFALTARAAFGEAGVTVEVDVNAAFGPTHVDTLRGRATD